MPMLLGNGHIRYGADPRSALAWVGAGLGAPCLADKAEQGGPFARRIFQPLTRRVPESRVIRRYPAVSGATSA
jgi:hypothetical protein